MGKRAYVMKNYSGINSICDLALEELKQADLITNIHEGVKNLMRREIDPVKYFLERFEIFQHSILIGDEIGSGIIPIEKFERQWRDTTGILYQELAARSETVIYIWSGLPLKLKG